MKKTGYQEKRKRKQGAENFDDDDDSNENYEIGQSYEGSE